MLRYIRDDKNFVLGYYAKIEDSPPSDLSVHARINTKNQLMVLSDSNWRIVQIMAEVQEHILCFIKVDQMIIAHMFQVQFLNKVLKVSTL